MNGFALSCLAGALLSGFGATASACCVETFRTTDNAHGLFEIREEAVRFILEENKKARPAWQVGDPNLKVFVPRCLVPLTAKWLPRSYGRSGINVTVSCARSIDKTELKQWDVFVPVWRNTGLKRLSP